MTKQEYTRFAVYKVSRQDMTGYKTWKQWFEQPGDEYPELIAILDDQETARKTAREIPFFEIADGFACKITRGAWSEIHGIRPAEETDCKLQEDYITVHGTGYAVDTTDIETFYPADESED